MAGVCLLFKTVTRVDMLTAADCKRQTCRHNSVNWNFGRLKPSLEAQASESREQKKTKKLLTIKDVSGKTESLKRSNPTLECFN